MLRKLARPGGCLAVQPGGLVPLEDSWRHPGLPVDSRAREGRNLTGTGPCRPAVTSTAPFFR